MSPIIKKYKHILVHLAVWCIFLFINGIHIYVNNGIISKPFLAVLLGNIAIFYINYLYLVPKFLLKKKLWLYLIFVLALVTVPANFFRLGIVRFNPPMEIDKEMPHDVFEGRFGDKVLVFAPGMDENITHRHRRDSIYATPKKDDTPLKRRVVVRPPFLLFTPSIISIAFLVIGTSVRVYSEWNKNEINKREIEKQKVRSELHFLKHQLNPHFLFNSLNNIYSLARKNSNDTPEAVITLSELMRYMLYRANNGFVLLKEELEYVQNYIKLQRLRIANGKKVSLNIYGTVSNQKIRPLLLISFIENAFKYGTDYKGNTEVAIKITIYDNWLEFKCTNWIGKRKENDKNSGIGLKNTKQRLELLYPKKHTLEVSEENQRFSVYLKLNLE